MVYNPFNVLLHLVCYYFAENFCIYVLKTLAYNFLFLFCSCLVLVSR